MKNKLMLIMLFALCFVQVVFAQTRTITGVVTSAEDGETLPGVSVVVKGTTVGTVTDFDGKYSLEVKSDKSIFIFSYIGMRTVEKAASAEVLNTVLESDAVGVDEVVVTAMGIKREKKSLGYAVQEVGSESVNKVQRNNFMSSLSGKVSGVHVKAGTNFGGSSNVIIRGNSSLTGNNQALYVIDGIPVDNTIENDDNQVAGGTGYDYGNPASDINPNDIESISVLKGAAATALYGSRAANGVILVTTKKGKPQKGLGVSISSNVTFSKIDKSTMPDYQMEYGGGYGPYYSETDKPGLEYYDVDGDGSSDYVVPFYEDASRGECFDENLLVYQWDAFFEGSPNYMTATPWTATDNGPETFFETGILFSNSVDISGGNNKTTYRLSYSNFNQDGTLPNSNIEKNSLLFTGSHKMLSNLKISSSANFINSQSLGRPSTGYNDNIMSMFRQWYQVNVDMEMQEKLYQETKKNATWNHHGAGDTGPAYWDNPYWTRYENYQNDERNRFIAYAKLDWDIGYGLSFMGRYALDTYNELREERRAVGSIATPFGVNYPEERSGYARKTIFSFEQNIDFLLKYNADLTADLNLNAFVGTNFRRNKYDYVFASTSAGIAVPGLYSLNNSVDPMQPPVESYYRRGENGYFGSVSLGYDQFLFLDATFRVDQSSTLPSENNTYVYPSVTASMIFSELFDASWLSFGKLRLNFAEVGNSAEPLSIADVYSITAPFNGTPMVTVPDTKKNPELKPERQRSYEGGLEMKLFNNRAGFDLAFYKTNTFDQLIDLSTSYSTGYYAKQVNAGEIQNNGIELTLNVKPVVAKEFEWAIDVNWSKNTNKVVKLYEDAAGNKIENLQLASLQGGITINAREGEAYGTIQGSDYVYHDNGQPIVKSNGRYQVSSGNSNVIGNYNPDWIGGVSNTFMYKDFALSFLIDGQKGGDIFSLDMWYGASTGLYKESVGLNDLGNPKRDPVVQNDDGAYASNSGGTINPGVFEDGTPNTVRVDNGSYSADGYAVSPNSRFVYDASFIKLREVSFSYNLPSSLISKTFLTSASVSFVGSNLWIIHKNLPHADPEASQGAGNVQGWQSGVMPAEKNFGFSVNLKF